MPKPKEMKRLAREATRHAESESPADADDGWWDAVLSDARAAGKPQALAVTLIRNVATRA
jgi:hypothetical protein